MSGSLKTGLMALAIISGCVVITSVNYVLAPSALALAGIVGNLVCFTAQAINVYRMYRRE